jgi:hypothetical protein
MMYLLQTIPYPKLNVVLAVCCLAGSAGCGSTAYNFNKKYRYFKYQLNGLCVFEEKESIKWYLKHVSGMRNGQLFGVCLFAGLALVCLDGISSIWEVRSGMGLYTLFVVSLISLILWIHKKKNQKTLDETLANDKRLPVLFLRSFEQDEEAPLTIFDALSKGSKKLISYEELAIGDAKLLGPVIAIASPLVGEKRIFGAAKGHVEDWQKDVSQFMLEASLVIMRPFGTEGLLWEFEQLITLGHLQKTVLYVNFGGREKRRVFKLNKTAYDYFRQEVLNRFRIDVGDYQPKAPYVFFDSENVAHTTHDYFDIPIFRRAFYHQYLVQKNSQP